MLDFSFSNILHSNFINFADSLEHIEDELKAIVDKAEQTAKSFEQKAREDLDKSVALLKQNIEKQIETEQNHIKGELLNNVASSSIEIAQRQIKTALDKDKQLHRKYIEDFINSIDKADV